MLLSIFTIYDEKAKAYLAPFFLPTTGMAVRTFTDMINNPECAFYKHPEDYTIFKIGTFDDSLGLLLVELKPTSLHNGVTLKNIDQEADHEISDETPIFPSTKSGNSAL